MSALAFSASASLSAPRTCTYRTCSGWATSTITLPGITETVMEVHTSIRSESVRRRTETTELRTGGPGRNTWVVTWKLATAIFPRT